MNLPAAFLALRERFIARLPERLAQMRAQLDQPQPDGPDGRHELKRLAHSLVGAAGLHDMEPLARAATELEQLAAAGADQPRLEQALDELARIISSQDSSPQSAPEPVEHSRQIALLFQDEDEMATQSALLEGAGYQVQRFRQAGDIDRALAHGLHPDLLLMGLQFHGQDQAGLGILERLKRTTLAEIPVIVLSASNSVNRGLAAYRAGAARVLTKPVSPMALQRHIGTSLAPRFPALLDVLLMNDGEASLPGCLTAAEQPPWSIRSCPDLESLFKKLAAQRPDAVVLCLAYMSDAVACAVVSLVRDHPSANHVPIICMGPDRQHRRTLLHQAGCTCHFDNDRPPREFGAMLSTLCDNARRVRAAIAEADRYRYEHARQQQALAHHAIISLADAAGTIYETSSQHARLTGYRRTELIGAHLSEQRPGMAAPEFDQGIMQQVSQGQVWQGEYRVENRTGQTRWFSGTIVPFLDQHGQAYRYMVIRTDISERKLGEQALAAAHDRELALAGQIQNSLLVPPLPWVVSGIPVASRFEPATGAAGDFHALVEVQTGIFDILIGDVMGKGTTAALVGAACKMAYTQCLLALRARTNVQPPTPAEIITDLHDRLSQRLIELECFVTLTYARFDSNAGTITSVGCGHPEIQVFNQDQIHSVANQHPPLGTLNEERYVETITSWQPGDLAMLYSDGLTETRTGHGKLLGDEGLRRLVKQKRAICPAPASLTADIMQTVRVFAGDQPPTDDRTLIAVLNPLPGTEHVQLDADLGALIALRSFLNQRALPDLPVAYRQRIELASVECFSNIIRHGEIQSRIVQVSCIRAADGIRIEFHYDGPNQAPPVAAPLPDPASLQESGYGLALIEILCARSDYSHYHGCNRQSLFFNQSVSTRG